MNRGNSIGKFVVLLLCAGCTNPCLLKRKSECRCPTDIRQMIPWVVGEDAIFHCPCGPSPCYYGYRPTCWNSWPSSGSSWRNEFCGEPPALETCETEETLYEPGPPLDLIEELPSRPVPKPKSSEPTPSDAPPAEAAPDASELRAAHRMGKALLRASTQRKDGLDATQPIVLKPKIAPAVKNIQLASAAEIERPRKAESQPPKQEPTSQKPLEKPAQATRLSALAAPAHPKADLLPSDTDLRAMTLNFVDATHMPVEKNTAASFQFANPAGLTETRSNPETKPSKDRGEDSQSIAKPVGQTPAPTQLPATEVPVPEGRPMELYPFSDLQKVLSSGDGTLFDQEK